MSTLAMIKDPEILIVAGEASGDHYGAELVHKITELQPSVKFFGMGGDRMAACGVDTLHHIREVSVMGFLEVLSRIRPLYRSFRRLVDEARVRRPVAAVFIDFPDYNLRLAPKIKAETGTRTIYYIGPTVWAWRPSRVEIVKRAIDRMLVIFPFEEPIYREAGVDVRFVGHPLSGTVRPDSTDVEFRTRFRIPPDRPIVALLPGSRSREVAHLLPVLVAAGRRLARDHGPIELALGLADSIERREVEPLLEGLPAVTIVERATHDLMKHARLLLVACGTAPLEGALVSTPQVVVYRTTPLSYGIASRLVKVPHVCMVNLILEERAVPELIQHQLTVESLVAEARPLLHDGPEREAQIAAFSRLRMKLGAGGAARRAAKAVLETAGLLTPHEGCEQT